MLRIADNLLSIMDTMSDILVKRADLSLLRTYFTGTSRSLHTLLELSTNQNH